MGAICCKQRKDGQPTSSPTVSFTNVTEDGELAEGCVNQGFNTKHDVQEGSGDEDGRYAREPTASSSQTPSTDAPTPPSTAPPKPPSTDAPKPLRTDAPTSPKTSKADVKGRGSRIVSALHDYTSKTTEEDLLFQKDDRMIVLDDSDPGWLLAEHMETNEKGYIPRDYVAEENVQENMDTNTDAGDDPDVKQRKPLPKVPTTPSTDAQTTPSTDVQTTTSTDALPGDSSVHVQARLVIALWDYNGTDPVDLSIIKDDVMAVLDDTDPDWWHAENTKTKKKGFIPSNYVADANSLEFEDWYHGRKSRVECEELLLLPDNQVGMFLVRGLPATRTASHHHVLSVLSVRTVSEEQGIVIHYKIETMDASGDFYMNVHPPSTHTSIQKLVDHYRNTDGLCCRLTQSCPPLKPALSDLSKSIKDKWETAQSEFQLGKELGHGCFGDVYEGEWKKNKTKVAIKTLKPGSMSKEDFLKEATIMKKCNHDNLVRLLAVCAQTEPMYIVTELMPKGDLLKYLRKDGQSKPMEILVHMIAQVSDGMAYLERMDYVHRDLAARNILVGEMHNVKVADFGLARILDGAEYKASADKLFPIKWTALEGLLYDTFTVKSDVWSFAILVYEIVTRGEKPYPGVRSDELTAKLKEGFRMPQPKDNKRPEETPTLDEIWKIQSKCWAENPDNRPTFESLSDFYGNLVVNPYGEYLEPCNREEQDEEEREEE